MTSFHARFGLLAAAITLCGSLVHAADTIPAMAAHAWRFAQRAGA